jgi:O-antigen ligase
VVSGGVALLCLAVVLLDAGADLLPDEAVVGIVTPLRLVVGVGLLAAVVGLGSPLRLWTVLDAAVAGLVLASALATVAAGQDWSGWRAVVTSVAVYYLAVAVRRTSSGSPGVIGLLALLGCALAATSAVQQGLAGTETGFCRGAANATADICGSDALIRVTGTFPNPNLLAAFLVLILPLAAVGSAALAERASRVLGTGVVVLGYAAVLLTASRGGVLGALAGAGVFVVLRRPSARRIAAAVLALAVAVAALLLAAGGSVGVRADVWTESLRMIGEHPLGVGPGRAGPLLAAAVPGDEQFQHAHNLWLNWLVETGYLGLAGILGVTVGAGAITAYTIRRDTGVVAAALAAGLAGFAVIGLADHPANASRLSLVMWTVLGLLAGLLGTGRPVRERVEQEAVTTPMPVSARSR